jgi:hypothetical protein
MLTILDNARFSLHGEDNESLFVLTQARFGSSILSQYPRFGLIRERRLQRNVRILFFVEMKNRCRSTTNRGHNPTPTYVNASTARVLGIDKLNKFVRCGMMIGNLYASPLERKDDGS